MKRLILASGSPRKREILSKLGLPFEVMPSSYEEDMSAMPDQLELAKFLSLGKARDVAQKIAGEAVVIGADTFISLDNEFLGKPKNADEARSMLQRLSGRTHEIITGVALIDTSAKLASRWTKPGLMPYRKEGPYLFRGLTAIFSRSWACRFILSRKN